MLTQKFDIYPALDVLNGRVVRLSQGRRERITVEGGDPVVAAERFAKAGASWLHLVDLDGAFSGVPDLGLVERVAACGLPVQVGGGYRTVESVAAALELGAARVLVGTAALEDIFLHAAAARFGDSVAVAVDARAGRVQVDGWTTAASASPGALAARCAAAGIRRLVVTSTRRDGTMAGPEVPLLREVLTAELPVIAAGGIASLDDLRRLRALGCEGAVVGSAIWLGRFSVDDAASLQV